MKMNNVRAWSATFFAQCLMYAGTALGIDVMVDYKLKRSSER